MPVYKQILYCHDLDRGWCMPQIAHIPVRAAIYVIRSKRTVRGDVRLAGFDAMFAYKNTTSSKLVGLIGGYDDLPPHPPYCVSIER